MLKKIKSNFFKGKKINKKAYTIICPEFGAILQIQYINHIIYTSEYICV